MSISYEIYKKAVGGKTWNGEDMKQFEEMPENIQKGWKAIDEHYTKKKTPEKSKVYDELKKKEMKEFEELPPNVKNIFANLDKNYEKLLKLQEPKKPKKEKAVKAVKAVKPEAPKNPLKENNSKKKKEEDHKLALQKLKGISA